MSAICPNASSGCDYPTGQCAELCMHKGESLISRARFAVEHPDVLHTPAMCREIIAGLLEQRDELLVALEYIYNAHHPEGAEHMPELRGIKESEFDALIAEKARDAISKVKGDAA